ncbi:rho-associated protein kinase 1-like isoform X1 [Pantherophis guttatus]|uniref:Rho-associated protein kinase 1-like isoform X1 n=1 Tax=Pantherophis guttatus TaxID=94885 RepID=A0ABM3ZAI2_PANGU|nr:rho-associated protein kinase 1-like isoform X1 [Pantherophis guttatus]
MEIFLYYGGKLLFEVCLNKYKQYQRDQKIKRIEELALLQGRELAEKNVTIRALEEENSHLASKVAVLLRENEELEKKIKDNPERDADRDMYKEYEVLKDKYEMYQKVIRRAKTEVSKEREKTRELVRARDQAIDDVCSEIVSLPVRGRPRRLCQRSVHRNT